MSKFDAKKDWFDPDAVPAITKLLSTDYATLVNGMNLINMAKDTKKIEEVTRTEGHYLIKKW